MAGPVIMGALAVPAIGFLLRFYVALSHDQSQRAHRGADLVWPAPSDEVVEWLIWRL